MLHFLFGYLSSIFENNSSVTQYSSISTSHINTTPTPGITPTTEATTTPIPTDTPIPTPSPTSIPTAIPTHTPKPGEVLYTANFTNKSADWSYDPSQWFIANGRLIGKEGGQAQLNVPITTSDYTITTDVIVANTNASGLSADFGFVARYQSSSQGDEVALANNGTAWIALSTCPGDSCAGPTSYVVSIPINQVFHLSITCKGTDITVSGLGHIIHATDVSNAPAPGSVVILNNGMAVQILSLQVIAA